MSFKLISIFIILFLIALFPRVYNLDQTIIYPDEITWLARGKELISATRRFDLKYFKNTWWSNNEHESIALPLTLTSTTSLLLLGKDQKFSLNLLSDEAAGRLPIAIFGALTIPLFFLFAKKFISDKTSLLFSILLAFDPIYLALSRWIMNDVILTFFAFLSIFCFLNIKQNKIWLLLASLSLALACLTRPTAVLVGISWIFITLFEEDKLKNKFLFLIKGILLTFFFIWVFWLGSWQLPIISYFQYVFQQAKLAQSGLAVFFMGEVTTNPSIFFYLFQIITRIPIFILLPFLISPILFLWKFIKIKNIHIFLKDHLSPMSILIFCLLFLGVISFSSLKMGVRYALPLWPGIYLASAWTTDQFVKKFKNQLYVLIIFILFLITSLINLYSFFPNYYLFYNQLIGGPRNAQQYDLVGHCLGSKKALDFLNTCSPKINTVAIMGCSKVTAPYYFSGNINTDWKKTDVTIVDYTLEQLSSKNDAIKYFHLKKPTFIASENGAILSKVYFKNSQNKYYCSSILQSK